MSEKFKLCRGPCGLVKHVSKFYRRNDKSKSVFSHCKTCSKESWSAWKKKHPTKNTPARRRANKVCMKRRLKELREKILDFFGRKCGRCGFDDVRALVIAHLFDGGAKERRAAYNRYGYLLRISESLDSGRYGILCANCNTIQEFERVKGLTKDQSSNRVSAS